MNLLFIIFIFFFIVSYIIKYKIKSWEQCTFLVFTAMALLRLRHLGASCTVDVHNCPSYGQMHEAPQSNCGVNGEGTLSMLHSSYFCRIWVPFVLWSTHIDKVVFKINKNFWNLGMLPVSVYHFNITIVHLKIKSDLQSSKPLNKKTKLQRIIYYIAHQREFLKISNRTLHVLLLCESYL